MSNEDFNYLLNLSYEQIMDECSKEEKYRNICETNWFWQKKSMSDFGISRDTFRSMDFPSSKEKYEYLADVKDPYFPPGEEFWQEIDKWDSIYEDPYFWDW